MLDNESRRAYIPSMLMKKRSRSRSQPDTLKAWRVTEGLTTREAGDLLGLSQSGYSKVELGRRVPRPALAVRLIRVTGVSLASLMGIAE